MVNDGTYYRIHVEDGREIERKRWAFFFDWDIENPSNDETVVSPSLGLLSEEGQEIVIAAKEFPSGFEPGSGTDSGFSAYSAKYDGRWQQFDLSIYPSSR